MLHDRFINLYDSIGDGNPSIFRFRYKSAFRYLITIISNLILPLYFRITNSNRNYRINKTDDSVDDNYIVSLTSFPARIKNVWLTIETILRQTKKPDRVILWLSEEQFPQKEEGLPSKLNALRSRGLEIRFVKGDLRSHKKYFYVMKEYPQANIITIDDDLYYSSSLISELIKYHCLNEFSIISNYGYEILYDKDGQVMPYSKWPHTSVAQGSSYRYFFGSGGGTLFPPNSLNNEVLNIDLALQLCPLADDIWLNAMSQLNGTEIIKINAYPSLFSITNSQDAKLCSINQTGGKNDEQIANIKKSFPNTYYLN